MFLSVFVHILSAHSYTLWLRKDLISHQLHRPGKHYDRLCFGWKKNRPGHVGMPLDIQNTLQRVQSRWLKPPVHMLKKCAKLKPTRGDTLISQCINILHFLSITPRDNTEKQHLRSYTTANKPVVKTMTSFSLLYQLITSWFMTYVSQLFIVFIKKWGL